MQRGFGGVPGQAQDDELALVHVDGARVVQVRRRQAAVQNAIEVDAREPLRAGALRQQVEGRLQLLRLLLLLLRVMVRLLSVLPVGRCGVIAAAPWAPVTTLLSPVQPALLLLLLALKVRRVDVGVVLHGSELLGVDTGEIWRMLRAPAAVLPLEDVVPDGAADLVVLPQLLVAVRGVAGQRRTGAPAAGDRPAAFRAGCRRGRGAGGCGISNKLRCGRRCC